MLRDSRGKGRILNLKPTDLTYATTPVPFKTSKTMSHVPLFINLTVTLAQTQKCVQFVDCFLT